MIKKNLLSTTLLCTSICVLGAALPCAADVQVSGLQPYQRPAWAPSIDQVQHDKAWFAQALTGVSQPYPVSLRFLENQGNWYTPFDRPGMPAPYDIRGWYAQ